MNIINIQNKHTRTKFLITSLVTLLTFLVLQAIISVPNVSAQKVTGAALDKQAKDACSKQPDVAGCVVGYKLAYNNPGAKPEVLCPAPIPGATSSCAQGISLGASGLFADTDPARQACKKYDTKQTQANFKACLVGYDLMKQHGSLGKANKCSGNTKEACETGAKAGKKKYDADQKQKEEERNKANAPKDKTGADKMLVEYTKDCKNYDPSKHKDKKWNRCKTIRGALASTGCNFGKGKASEKALDNCQKKINREFGDVTTQSDIDLAPLETAGAEADEGTIVSIKNIIFGLAGSLALLFVVIGGVRYILSRGDPNATAQAKNTIIYAIVGLIVTIMAYAIVGFVVNSVL